MNRLETPEASSEADDGRWPEWLALSGILALAAGVSGAKALQSLGMALIFIGTLPVLPHMVRRFARDPLAIAVLLFTAYLAISALTAPEPSNQVTAHWDLARKMSRVLLLPIIAYWLSRGENRVEWTLAAVLLGTVAVLIEQWISWGSVWPMFTGKRIGFGMNPIWMGLNASLLLLGLVALARRLVYGGRRWLPLAAMLWLLLLLLILQVVVVSQSRGAYLALAAGAVCLAWLGPWRTATNGGAWRRRHAAVALAVVALVAAMIFAQTDVLAKRIIGERETIAMVLSGDADGVPMTPIGERVHMYIAALEAWPERPWFGWGPDGSRIAIARAELPQGFTGDQVHNGLLDVLVRFGIVGAALFYAIVAILVRASWRDLAAGRGARDVGAFLLAGLVTLAVADLTESYISSGYGWSVLVLLGASIYARRLRYEPTSRVARAGAPGVE